MTKKRLLFNRTILLIVIFSILAVLTLAYSINNSYTPDSGSEIKIYNASEESVFYLDNKQVQPSLLNAQYAVLSNVPDGEHILIVHKDAHLPWAKNLILTEGIDVEVATFNLPKVTKISIIPEYVLNDSGKISNDMYKDIDSLFAKPLSTSTSYNKNVFISQANSNITTTWLGSEEFIPYFFCIRNSCDVVFTVISTETEIRDIAFYPKRDNIVIFSTNNSVNAIELDRNGTQNFQPIYIGDEPHLRLDLENTDSIYIKDGETLMRIAI